MKMFQHTPILPALAAFAAIGAVATLQSATDQSATTMGDELGQPSLQDPVNQETETMDRPQALSLEEERLTQLRHDLAASERAIARLRDRLASSVRDLEKVALRQKLTEQEAIQHRLAKELRKHELDQKSPAAMP